MNQREPMPDLKTQLREREADLIHAALAESAGNVSAAARALGLSPRHLYLRLRALGIDPNRYRAEDNQWRVEPKEGT